MAISVFPLSTTGPAPKSRDRQALGAELLLGLGYFVSAALALHFARLEGSPSFIWPSNALLAARLAVIPRRRWDLPVALCALAGLFTAWLFGFGWKVAPGLTLANLAEAALVASLLQRLSGQAGAHGGPEASLRRLGALLGVLALVAPACSTLIAGITFWALGMPVARLSLGWGIGHALGLIILLPSCRMLSRLPAEIALIRADRWQATLSLGFFLGTSAVILACFWQSAMPLLFVPTIMLALSVVWVDRATLAALYLVLTLVAGVATAHGQGPLTLYHQAMPARLQLLQLYLAAAVLGTMPISEAVQRRARLVARLRESEARYRLLADNSTDIITSTDAEGIIRFVSPSILQLAHHQPRALIGTPALELVAPEHRARVAAAHKAALAEPGRTVPVEFQGLPRNAPPRWYEAYLRAVADEAGEGELVVSIARDMNARKEVETALALAALTDPLTGLANRRLFMRSLEECITAGKPGCVALFDLDHFKAINDTYGHPAGDAVLREFALLARQGLRVSDTLARIGGEEFALLLPGTGVDVAEVICARLAIRLSQTPVLFEGASIRVTSSVGLARLGRDGALALAAADRALYQAKAEGRDRLSIAA